MILLRNIMLKMRLLPVLSLLFLLAWTEGSPLGGTLLPDEIASQIEKHLQEQYGEQEVEYFREMLRSFDNQDANLSLEDEQLLTQLLEENMGQGFVNELNKMTRTTNGVSDQIRLVQTVVKLLKQQFSKLRSLEKQYITPNWHHFVEIESEAKNLPVIGEGTPCSNDATCKRLEVLVNRCNFARTGANFAYDIFLVITHVLNTMISVLCACLFIGPVHLCILKNFPYTCVFPYPVYQSLFMATSAVWETVKATSTLCRVYGDPGIASVLS